jgi:hypothetical protein
MPLGAARLNFLAKSITVAPVVAEVIRKKVGIQAIGDAQIDTAQSKFGGASAYFDGTGDLLQASTDASLTIPSSEDFTIEGWIRPGSVSGIPGLLTDRATSLSLSGVNWDISIYNGSYLGTRTATLLFETGSGAGNIIIISNNNVFTTNTWYHFAVVRSSDVISMYVNGVDVTNNRAGTQSAGIGAGNLTIGGFPNGALMYSGHFDEIRWSNTARYTSGFTPSTAPFVNDGNTKLLLHMDGTDGSTYFDDDNGVSRSAVGVVGNGSIQIDTAQSYFGGSSCLAPGSADSLLFDGSLIPLSGNFTIESYVRFTGTASRKMLYSQYTTGTGRTSMEIGTDEKASFFCASQGSFQEADRILGDSALSVDTWYHIAVVRDGSNFTMYIDGVAQADTITHSANVQDQDFEIFGDDFGTHTDDVWQDEFRISDTARYTANFTRPTAPFVNDSNTLLLLHMDGTDGSTLFLDDNGVSRSRVGVSAIGDAQIDTAQSKFGGASAYFDGTDDKLSVDIEVPILDSSKSTTIEFWYRRTASGVRGICEQMIVGQATGFCLLDINGVIYAYRGATAGTTMNGGSLSLNTWYHIAVVQDAGTGRLFIDGTQVDSDASWNGTDTTGIPFEIGIGPGNASGFYNATEYDLYGHIDEFRISNTARYTSGFTPPTEAFTPDANTLLLLHMDGTDGDTDFVDDNGKEST